MDEDNPVFAGFDEGGDLPRKGSMNIFTLGRNHNTMNTRDRVIYSTCFKGDSTLMVIRIVLLVLSVLILPIGITFGFTNEADLKIKLVDLFCTVDFYAWISFIFYLIFAIISTRRVQNFEKNKDPDLLNVEVYQSVNNFYQKKLTVVEKLAVLFYSISFLLNLPAFVYSVTFFARFPDVNEDLFLEESSLRILIVNSLFFVLVMINTIVSRQILTLPHFCLAVALGVIFLGGNAGCSIGFDIVIYEDLNWQNIDVPRTIYEALGAFGSFIVAYIIGKLIECGREKYYYAHY